MPLVWKRLQEEKKPQRFSFSRNKVFDSLYLLILMYSIQWLLFFSRRKSGRQDQSKLNTEGLSSHLSCKESRYELTRSPNLGSVLGLAADARNEIGFLSIQTPLLEVSSYDLFNTMPGIFLLIHITVFVIPGHLLSCYSLLSREDK